MGNPDSFPIIPEADYAAYYTAVAAGDKAEAQVLKDGILAQRVIALAKGKKFNSAAAVLAAIENQDLATTIREEIEKLASAAGVVVSETYSHYHQ